MPFWCASGWCCFSLLKSRTHTYSLSLFLSPILLLHFFSSKSSFKTLQNYQGLCALFLWFFFLGLGSALPFLRFACWFDKGISFLIFISWSFLWFHDLFCFWVCHLVRLKQVFLFLPKNREKSGLGPCVYTCRFLFMVSASTIHSLPWFVSEFKSF